MNFDNNNSFNNIKANSNMDYIPLGFDLLKYFNDKETSDLKIIVGEHTFYVHKVNLHKNKKKILLFVIIIKNDFTFFYRRNIIGYSIIILNHN